MSRQMSVLPRSSAFEATKSTALDELLSDLSPCKFNPASTSHLAPVQAVQVAVQSRGDASGLRYTGKLLQSPSKGFAAAAVVPQSPNHVPASPEATSSANQSSCSPPSPQHSYRSDMPNPSKSSAHPKLQQVSASLQQSQQSPILSPPRPVCRHPRQQSPLLSPTKLSHSPARGMMSPGHSRAGLLPQPSPLRRATGPGLCQAHCYAVPQQALASPPKLVCSPKLQADNISAAVPGRRAAEPEPDVQSDTGRMSANQCEGSEMLPAGPTLVPPQSPFACVAHKASTHEAGVAEAAISEPLLAVPTLAAEKGAAAPQGLVADAAVTVQQTVSPPPAAISAAATDSVQMPGQQQVASVLGSQQQPTAGDIPTVHQPRSEHKAVQASPSGTARMTKSAPAATPKQRTSKQANSAPALSQSADGATATSQPSRLAVAASAAEPTAAPTVGHSEHAAIAAEADKQAASTTDATHVLVQGQTAAASTLAGHPDSGTSSALAAVAAPEASPAAPVAAPTLSHSPQAAAAVTLAADADAPTLSHRPLAAAAVVAAADAAAPTPHHRTRSAASKGPVATPAGPPSNRITRAALRSAPETAAPTPRHNTRATAALVSSVNATAPTPGRLTRAAALLAATADAAAHTPGQVTQAAAAKGTSHKKAASTHPAVKPELRSTDATAAGSPEQASLANPATTR